MSRVIGNSGFLFSTHKYDEEKRFSAILTFKSIEEAITKSITLDEVIYKLNNYYREKCSDIHPYHYIIMPDGSCHNIRDSILAVPSARREFQEYKDDIKILIMADRLNDLNADQEKSLVNILAKESIKYAVLLSDTLYFQKAKNIYVSEIDKYNAIIRKAILTRNERYSIFSIIEHVIGEEVIINKKIKAIPPLINELGLPDVAIRYNVPLSILKNLNPHITESNSQDIVFIPNVRTLEYKYESIKTYKEIASNAGKIKNILEVIRNGA